MAKHFALLSLWLLTAVAFSAEATAQTQNQIVAPQYRQIGIAPCRVPIIVGPNSQGASATVYRGRPVIIVDRSQLRNVNWYRFVIAHECGHHVNGDTLPRGLWFRKRDVWGTARQELAADCFAASRVPRPIAMFAARYFALGQGPHSGGPGYPTGQQRAANILRCAGLR